MHYLRAFHPGISTARIPAGLAESNGGTDQVFVAAGSAGERHGLTRVRLDLVARQLGAPVFEVSQRGQSRGVGACLCQPLLQVLN
jgi:hypothetical protein